MAESNGRQNGRMTGMAGMAERQKEWQMAELQITITTYENGRMAVMATRMAGWLNVGMVEWQEWWPNGGIVGMAAEWRNGGRMA